MAKHKVEIQDHLGNIYYPHTTTDVVFDGSGKRLSSLLDNKSSKSVLKQTLTLVPTLKPFSGQSNRCCCYKSDNELVTLNCSAQTLDSSNSIRANENFKIGVLPIGFRPSFVIAAAGETNSPVAHLKIVIKENGEIYINPQVDSWAFGFTVSYYAA